MTIKTNFITKFSHWIRKTKLYHLLFWAVYQYLWWALYEGSTLKAFNYLFLPPLTLKFLFYVIFQTLGVYFSLYYLIPKFLEKRKYILFIVSVCLTIVIMAALILKGYYISTSLFGHDVYDYFGFKVRTPYYIFKTQALPSSITVMALGMSIKLAKNYLEVQKQQQLLEKEKLETELKFLKSQFNPHFLFNTINSIFVLIRKNQEMATESLAKFSELLRYQLYECNEPEIPLNREINYLSSFIELEKLRQNENFKLNAELIKNSGADFVVAPFIFMPFIENGFKHVSSNPNTINWIDLKMSLSKNVITFKIVNSVANNYEKSREAIDYSGLGLKNVERRLDLLYPEKHELITNKFKDKYEVILILQLKRKRDINLKLV